MQPNSMSLLHVGMLASMMTFKLQKIGLHHQQIMLYLPSLVILHGGWFWTLMLMNLETVRYIPSMQKFTKSGLESVHPILSSG